MDKPVYSVEAGTDASWLVTIQVTDSEGDQVPFNGFTSGDTLSAEVWAGQTGGVLATPSATWQTTPNTGVFALSLPASQTASLTPGRYWLRVLVNATDGTVRPVLDEVLKVAASPGTAATSIVPYCSHDDLLEFAPFLDSLEDVDTDLSGFQRQRIRARQWLDSIIITRGPSNASNLGGSISPWSLSYSSDGNSQHLVNLLKQNLLLVTPRVVEMTARKAIAYIIDGLIAEKGTDYRVIARQHEAHAVNLVAGFVADLDLNGDGISDLSIPCNYYSTRIPTPNYLGGLS